MGQNVAKGNRLSALLSSPWLPVFLLFLAVLGCYLPSLHAPFINLDDPDYIRDNPFIRDLSWKGIYEIFSRPIVGNYFPLQILSYTVDYQIWHVQSFGYHLHNMVLHVLNAVLVFLLLKKIFSSSWASFLAALFFALHPVQVESVTWVSERKNLLVMAFLLSSFLSYLYYREEERPGRKRAFYLLALLLFFPALLAKVSAVVLPLLFILYDFCFPRLRIGETIKDKIPFFLLAFLFSLVTLFIYRYLNDLVDFHGGSPYHNFLAMANVFVEYVIYLIVPFYLDHYYRTRIPATVWEPQVLLSLATIFLLGLLAWRSWRRDRLFFFCFGWFVVSLLPVINIIPIAILRADRYMYAAAVGFFYLVSAGLVKILRMPSRRIGIPVFLGCTLTIAGAYAHLTLERNRLWNDYVSLWEDNLRKFPQSVMAYKSIGHASIDKGRLDEAISLFRTGLKENPNKVALLTGLANAYQSKGDLEKAEEILVQTSRIHPRDSVVFSNLGNIYLQKGEVEKAGQYTRKAIDLDRKNYAAHTNLGVVYFHLNQWDESIRELEKAIELSPGSIQPYLNLAVVYNLKGSLEKAESYLKQGLEYVPQSHAAHLMLGRMCWEQKKIGEARHYVSRAYQLRPNDPQTNYFMGLLTLREADGYFQKAQRIQTQRIRMEPVAGKGPDRRAP